GARRDPGVGRWRRRPYCRTSGATAGAGIQPVHGIRTAPRDRGDPPARWPRRRSHARAAWRRAPGAARARTGRFRSVLDRAHTLDTRCASFSLSLVGRFGPQLIHLGLAAVIDPETL